MIGIFRMYSVCFFLLIIPRGSCSQFRLFLLQELFERILGFLSDDQGTDVVVTG